MDSLPSELLEIIFDEHADDSSTIYSCVLVNRKWCAIALQYLWAKPFTSLLSSPKRNSSRLVENLLATFIECFTEVYILKDTAQLCKKHIKKFPFDYSLYLKEIRFFEIQNLAQQS